MFEMLTINTYTKKKKEKRKKKKSIERTTVKTKVSNSFFFQVREQKNSSKYVVRYFVGLEHKRYQEEHTSVHLVNYTLVF